jgi:3-phenylpropionate/trans-cinnamate dioxygenase ferredoxin subunit
MSSENSSLDVGDLADLAEGAMRHVDGLCPHGVVVCRVNGEVRAFDDNCSHRDARLSEGRLRGTVVTCPSHGARFEVVDGRHLGPPAATPIVVRRVEVVEGRHIVS